MKNIFPRQFNLYHFLAIGALLFGIALRLIFYMDYHLGLAVDEVEIGYDAWSLQDHGQDKYGQPWPLYLYSFGQGEGAVFSYILIPFIRVFGLHEWVIRLPALGAGILLMIFTYLLVKEVWDEKKAAYTMCLAAISPWLLNISHVSYNVHLVPLFFVASGYFIIRAFQKRKIYALLLGGIIAGLSVYTYVLAWVWTPLWLLLLCFFFGRKNWKYMGMVWIIFLAFFWPLIHWQLSEFGIVSGGYDFFGFTFPHLEQARFAQVNIFNRGGENVFIFIIWLLQYLIHFSPHFLWWNGNWPDFPPVFGIMHAPEAILVILGGIALWQERKQKATQWLMMWFLLAPLPVSVSATALPHTGRLVNWIPAWSIGAAFGISFLVTAWHKQKAIQARSFLRKNFPLITLLMIAGAIMISLVGVMVYYDVRGNERVAYYRGYGFDQLAQKIQTPAGAADSIIVSNSYMAAPYMYILFYFPQSRSYLEKKDMDRFIYAIGFEEVTRLGTYEFRRPEPQDLDTADIIVARPDEMVGIPADDRVVYPSGREAFKIYYGKNFSPHP